MAGRRLADEGSDAPPMERSREPTRLVERHEPSAAAPIRITIDRIDVRAILPPTPPAARPAAANGRPAMTLEDYTRQRNRR